jgi:hypothetical protein
MNMANATAGVEGKVEQIRESLALALVTAKDYSRNPNERLKYKLMSIIGSAMTLTEQL